MYLKLCYLFIPEYNRPVKPLVNVCSIFWLLYCLSIVNLPSPAYLQHKHFSISGHKVLWSVNRSGVFSKMTHYCQNWHLLRNIDGCSVQDGCWKLSAEVWGTWKTILLCLHMTLGNWECCEEQPIKSQEPLWSCVNIQYYRNSRKSIPLCASGHLHHRLCWMAPTLTVPTALCNTGIPTQASWCRAGFSHIRGLPCRSQGSCLPSARIWLGASPFTALMSLAASVPYGCSLSLPVYLVCRPLKLHRKHLVLDWIFGLHPKHLYSAQKNKQLLECLKLSLDTLFLTWFLIFFVKKFVFLKHISYFPHSFDSI